MNNDSADKKPQPSMKDLSALSMPKNLEQIMLMLDNSIAQSKQVIHDNLENTYQIMNHARNTLGQDQPVNAKIETATVENGDTTNTSKARSDQNQDSSIHNTLPSLAPDIDSGSDTLSHDYSDSAMAEQLRASMEAVQNSINYSVEHVQAAIRAQEQAAIQMIQAQSEAIQHAEQSMPTEPGTGHQDTPLDPHANATATPKP